MDKYDGYTELSFIPKNGRTLVDTLKYHGQSRVSARMQLNNEDTLCYFLIAMGGGLTEGEDYYTKISLAEDTRAIISTQAPTYIFKCDNHEITHQINEISVKKDAILEYLPDSLIPYRNARYRQDSEINVEKGGTLIYTDGLTSGWSPDGTEFSYEDIQLKTQITYDGNLMYADNVILEPNVFKMQDLGFFGDYKNYDSLVVVNEKINDAFVKELQDKFKNQDKVRVGISKLEGPGFVMRILGDNINFNRKVLMDCVDDIRGKLFGSPKLDLRKDPRFVY